MLVADITLIKMAVPNIQLVNQEAFENINAHLVMKDMFGIPILVGRILVMAFSMTVWDVLFILPAYPAIQQHITVRLARVDIHYVRKTDIA